MSDWQDISTAPQDGTPVRTGKIGPMSIGGEPLYPITSRYVEGRWCANFGSRAAERWVQYEPQPTHWQPLPAPPIEPASPSPAPDR